MRAWENTFWALMGESHHAETLQLNLRTKHDVFETKTLSADAKNLRLIHKVTANTHL